jgi:hypothetical protein
MELREPIRLKSLASYVSELHKRKEVNTMTYETPELTALTPAINAIQGTKSHVEIEDSKFEVEVGPGAYQDWE